MKEIGGNFDLERLISNEYYKDLITRKDIMPSLLLSLVMGAEVYSVQLFGMTVWPTLIVQGFV